MARNTISNERLCTLIDKVLKCRGLEDYNISIEIDKYGYAVEVWTILENAQDGINMYVYEDTRMPTRDRVHNGTRTINDAGLKKAEAHIDRIMEEFKSCL